MPVNGPQSRTNRAVTVPGGATPVTVPGSHVSLGLRELAIGVLRKLIVLLAMSCHSMLMNVPCWPINGSPENFSESTVPVQV